MTRTIERRHRARAVPRRAATGRIVGGHTSLRGATASELADAAPLFAALGDATRLRIVRRLSGGGALPIVRLTEGANVSRQAVTKHLRALEGVGLVRSGRAGRERLWELEPKRLADVRRYLDEISTQWDAALERLRTLVETTP